MSLCASCGLETTAALALCPHHYAVYGDDWSRANRIWCNFFHRGEPIPRLAFVDRDDEFWAHSGEAA